MDQGYTPQKFISLLDTYNHADQQVERMFPAEFGLRWLGEAGVNAAAAAYKR